MKNIISDSDHQEIVRRIHKVTPKSHGLWGRMDAHQMICHLNDQIRLALGDKPSRTKGSWIHRTLLKFLVLYVINAPREKVKTVHELDQNRGGTEPEIFENDHICLIKDIQRFRDMERDPHPHPVFGEMSMKEWGRLIWLHLDHHLRQFGA